MKDMKRRKMMRLLIAHSSPKSMKRCLLIAREIAIMLIVILKIQLSIDYMLQLNLSPNQGLLLTSSMKTRKRNVPLNLICFMLKIKQAKKYKFQVQSLKRIQRIQKRSQMRSQKRSLNRRQNRRQNRIKVCSKIDDLIGDIQE